MEVTNYYLNMNERANNLVKQGFYPNASKETILLYLELRDEGHSQYSSEILSGIRDLNGEED
jgi:hypothetical protein